MLSVYPFPLWWVGEYIYILCLIIIVKSEVWTITHCLGLGNETMVCAVHLSLFLSVSHFLSSLNNSPGLAGGNHYQKIIIPSFRRVLKTFSLGLLSLYFFLSRCFHLTVFRVLCHCSMLGSNRLTVNCCRAAVRNDKPTLWVPSLFVFLSTFLKLIITWRSCAIYMREGNDFNVEVIDTGFIWIARTLLSNVRQKAVTLKYPLTDWLIDLFIHSLAICFC